MMVCVSGGRVGHTVCAQPWRDNDHMDAAAGPQHAALSVGLMHWLRWFIAWSATQCNIDQLIGVVRPP